MSKQTHTPKNTSKLNRYQRQMCLPQVGLQGQQKLQAASVVVIGAGGLGCPALLYLTAAGVGRIGIVDSDKVELTNLHRQVLYTTQDIGSSKVEVAKQRLQAMNPEVSIEIWHTRLTHTHAQDILKSYDYVLDGTDNFPSRYLINDACVLLNKPLISGAVQFFEGQVTVLNLQGSACYRCLFPSPPPPELTPNCNEAGVLGVLPGWIGLIQAMEVIKLILNIGNPLTQKLLLLNALSQDQKIISFSKNKDCISCGSHPSILSLQDSQKNLETLRSCSQIPTTSFEELKVKLKSPKYLSLIDVRTDEEVALGILPHALHIPLHTFEQPQVIQRIKSLAAEHEIIVYCASGARSHHACEMLQQAGIPAFNYAGGYQEWTQRNPQL